MGLSIALAGDEALRREVYRFRYRVYVEELGIESAEADHEKRWLRDPLDEHSVSFALLDGSRVLGTVRGTVLEDLEEIAPLCEKFGLEPALERFAPGEIGFTSRLMLDPSLRHGRSLLRLMRAIYDHGLSRGIRLNYGDCSPQMLPFYERMGYRRYGRTFNDTIYGFKIPILMLVGDRVHFERVHSPIVAWSKSQPDDPEARAWFEANYPDELDPVSALLLPEGEFFDLLTSRLAGDPLHSIGLFRGLERAEAERVLARATLVKPKAGDQILRQNEGGDTAFVLISGIAEAQVQGRTLRLLGAGDTFGEIALLTQGRRTADVVARTPCEALVLTDHVLTDMVERDPAIASRVLLNLSRMLAERLASIPLDLVPR